MIEDGEALTEQIAATVTGLLGLLGIDADPLRSREHILVSTILGAAWKEGRDLDLPALIGQIQSPPVARIGVLELDAFFPEKDRFALAMTLNNLLASPGFEAWLEGEPLDIDRMLHGAGGKPRVSIFSIAHLGDAERMFFVSFLLNRMIGWMRSQSGTTSLRALLYMDEIFGYFPPVANPPSKAPLLTLLKQARAFGLGCVLATQNPVDLDYKGLANAGTWFLGRLQTERDKLRVLDGLQGAAAGAGSDFDRGAMERILSGLGSRVFLMHNVHDDRPEIFQTRWTLSYLRGPLTRAQIKSLKEKTAADGAEGGEARGQGEAEAQADGSRARGIPGGREWCPSGGPRDQNHRSDRSRHERCSIGRQSRLGRQGGGGERVDGWRPCRGRSAAAPAARDPPVLRADPAGATRGGLACLRPDALRFGPGAVRRQEGGRRYDAGGGLAHPDHRGPGPRELGRGPRGGVQRRRRLRGTPGKRRPLGRSRARRRSRRPTTAGAGISRHGWRARRRRLS